MNNRLLVEHVSSWKMKRSTCDQPGKPLSLT